jgi:ferredoxin
MEIKDVHLIYFSPTGTTKKIIDAFAEGLNPQNINRYDLTCELEAKQQSLESGIAVVGIPVYAGLVPEDCLMRLAGFAAQNIPTVLIALYGNREFEDALVELRDLLTPKGFKVVAAGAFIGEHSYATVEYPIAAGRPDTDDLRLARDFGQKVATKILADDFDMPEVDGNVPYKERVAFGGVAPETDDNVCILCGKCAEGCPVQVINVADSVVTDAQNCIMCAACIRACDAGARAFDHPAVKERRELLIKNCSVPKAPKIFL